MRAEPTRPSVPHALVRDLVGTVARGIRILEREAKRPPHFNDAALAHANGGVVLDDQDPRRFSVVRGRSVRTQSFASRRPKSRRLEGSDDHGPKIPSALARIRSLTTGPPA